MHGELADQVSIVYAFDSLRASSQTLQQMNVSDATAAETVPVTEGARVEQEIIFSDADLEAFARLSGDRAAVHFDDAFAIARGFPGRIVHGLLISARFSRLMGMFLPGEHSIIQSISLQYRRPVLVSTTVVFSIEVERFVEAVGAVVLKLSATAGGAVCAEGRAQCVLSPAEAAE